MNSEIKEKIKELEKEIELEKTQRLAKDSFTDGILAGAILLSFANAIITSLNLLTIKELSTFFFVQMIVGVIILMMKKWSEEKLYN